jgi:hypothetical protein
MRKTGVQTINMRAESDDYKYLNFAEHFFVTYGELSVLRENERTE